MNRYFVLFATLVALKSPVAAASAMVETCDVRPESSSPTLHLALGNVLGFGYVHHAFEQIAREFPRAEYCVSAVPLGRNAYQYYQYFVRVDVRETAGGKLVERVRFLYQDASVQAYHNTQGQPWVALDPAAVDDVVAAFVKRSSSAVLSGKSRRKSAAIMSQSETTVDAAAALAKKSRTFRALASQSDEQSLAIMHLSDSPRVDLVTALTRPSANPFAGTVRPYGVLINENDVVENVSLSAGLLFPLGKILDEAARKAGPKESWSDRVVELSRVH